MSALRIFSRLRELLDCSLSGISNGQVPIWNGTQFVTTNMFHPGLRSGLGYSTVGWSPGGSSGTVTAQKLYAVPIFVPHKTTITNIGILQSTNGTSGQVHRLGLYTNNAGIPGTLLIDASTSDASTGSSSAKYHTINQAVEAGWYWIAGVTNSGGQLWRCSGQQMLWAPLLAGSTAGNACYEQTASHNPSSALPSTFGAGTFISPQNVCPFLVWKV